MIVDSVLDRLLAWKGTRVSNIWNNPDYVVKLFLTDWTVTMPPSSLGAFVASTLVSRRSVHAYCIYFGLDRLH